MLKILIAFILALFFFVVLFFQKLREALSTGGMVTLLAILLGLSGMAAWLGYGESGRQKAGMPAITATKAGPPAPAAEMPMRTPVVPGDGTPSATGPARVTSPGDGALSAQELYRRIGPSIVSVLNYDASGNLRGIGTGFFIEPFGSVLTNHHVLQGAASAMIRTRSGKTYPVNGILVEDPDGDLILLSSGVHPDEVKTLPVTPALPDVGEKVFVIGSPRGFEQTLSDGLVSAIRKHAVRDLLIQITAPISPGSSGSPVVNMRGEVIGVASSGVLYGAQNLNFCIPGKRVANLRPGSSYALSHMAKTDLQTPLNLQPGQAEEEKRRADAEQRRAMEAQRSAFEAQRKWREQQISEASDILDKAKHNMSFDRYELAFSQYEEALQIFRVVRETQGMAICLEQMGVIQQKKGRHDIAQEYFRQAAAARGQR